MRPTIGLEQDALKSDGSEDKHLRSTDNVTGYSIKATDGKMGDVEDFLVDASSWKIDFIVVDTGHWFSGKKVLLSPNLIKEINWETASVIVETTEAQVKDSSEYDPDQELTGVHTLAIRNHNLLNYKSTMDRIRDQRVGKRSRIKKVRPKKSLEKSTYGAFRFPGSPEDL
jgi:hypothetical protein